MDHDGYENLHEHDNDVNHDDQNTQDNDDQDMHDSAVNDHDSHDNQEMQESLDATDDFEYYDDFEDDYFLDDQTAEDEPEAAGNPAAEVNQENPDLNFIDELSNSSSSAADEEEFGSSSDDEDLHDLDVQPGAAERPPEMLKAFNGLKYLYQMPIHRRMVALVKQYFEYYKDREISKPEVEAFWNRTIYWSGSMIDDNLELLMRYYVANCLIGGKERAFFPPWIFKKEDLVQIANIKDDGFVDVRGERPPWED